MKSSWFLITLKRGEARVSHGKCYRKHRADSGRQRYTEEESGRLRSMIMWSDDKVERAVPLWWSRHRPTRVEESEFLFGLALIFPSDNARQAVCCECFPFCHKRIVSSPTSAQALCYTSARHFDRQLVHIKNWQSPELSGSTVEKCLYRNTWQQKTKTKWFLCRFSETVCPLSWDDIFPTVEMGYAYFFHSNFNYKWLQSGLKMWQMENISFWDSYAYTKSRLFNDLCGAYLWQIASYGAGWFKRKSLKPDEEWWSLRENTECKPKIQLCPPSMVFASKDSLLCRTFIHFKWLIFLINNRRIALPVTASL